MPNLTLDSQIDHQTHTSVHTHHYTTCKKLNNCPSHIQSQHWNEFVNGSAIPPDLAALNFRSIEGEEVIELLAGKHLENVGGYGQQYVTRETQNILERYESAAEGGWRDCGLDPLNNFEPMEYGRFKANKPRIPAKRLQTGEYVPGDKPLKYDTPAGVPFRIFVPSVSIEAGYEIAKSIGRQNEYVKHIIHHRGFAQTADADPQGQAQDHSSIRFINPAQFNRQQRRANQAGTARDRSTGVERARQLGLRAGKDFEHDQHPVDRQEDSSHIRRSFGGGFIEAPGSTTGTQDNIPVQDSEGSREFRGRLNLVGTTETPVPEIVNQCGDEEDTGFWPWYLSLKRNPIIITEGAKKAASFLGQGFAAIAVPGVAMWHQKGERTLHPDLAPFCTGKRPITIAFDQDEKLKTIHQVSSQVRQLGEVLREHKSSVRVAVWPTEWGKGADDVIAAGKPIAACIEGALTLEDYKRDFRIEQLLKALKRYGMTSYTVERHTAGQYLPKLPGLEPSTIEVINATMNTGKTYRIGTDRISQWLKQGGHVLALSPLNSLGKQSADKWGILHIHDHRDRGKFKNEKAFWEMLSQKPGVVMCPDSINKLPGWFWSKPVLLVIDEANQVANHICQGDTLKKHYEAVLRQIKEAAQCAITSGGSILLSEDGIPDRTIKFFEAISGVTKVRYFMHRKQGEPWPTTVYSGVVSGFRKRLQDRMKDPSPCFFVSTSQRECKRLEHIAQSQGLKVHRIDSETNENGAYTLFFSNPDQWIALNQPDLLILSPSGKSGISIQGEVAADNAYFKDVWAYFPALDTDTHMQMLGRYRPSVPRHIYVKPFITGDAEERIGNPKGIKKRLSDSIKTMTKLFSLEECDRDATTLETAIADYLAEARTVSGIQKSIAQAALIARLEDSGHPVKGEQLEADKETADLWTVHQEMIWAEEAEQFAALEVEAGQDMSWAWRTLDSLESSHTNRMTARKVIWRDKFPGESFDDVDMCYAALFKDYGALRRGVQLQANAENLNATKELERSEVERVLNSSVRAGHRLPKHYAKALIMAELGVLELLGSTWSNTDKRAIAIKEKALRYAGEINYYLRLQIKPGQTPSDVCNKLIRKLGLNVASTSRPGTRGQQKNRIYAVADLDNPFRQRLLEASRRKLSESVSMICNKEIATHIRTVDTPLPLVEQAKPPVPLAVKKVGQVVLWGAQRTHALIESLNDRFAVLSDELGQLFHVPVDNLNGLEGVALVS